MMNNKIKKMALVISGLFLVVTINFSISNDSVLGAKIDLRSLIKKAMADGEGSSSGCSACGSGKSTCSVSCDGQKTWISCSNVQGIEALD